MPSWIVINSLLNPAKGHSFQAIDKFVYQNRHEANFTLSRESNLNRMRFARMPVVRVGEEAAHPFLLHHVA